MNQADDTMINVTLFNYRKELEKLRDDHQRAEELRREREEELWRIHEEHRAEIQQEKEKVLRMKEETQAQRDKAEAEIEYAHECLQKEREACRFHFLLLSDIHAGVLKFIQSWVFLLNLLIHPVTCMIKETSLAFKLRVYFEGVQYCSLILIIIFLRMSYRNNCFLWSLLILIAILCNHSEPCW